MQRLRRSLLRPFLVSGMRKDRPEWFQQVSVLPAQPLLRSSSAPYRQVQNPGSIVINRWIRMPFVLARSRLSWFRPPGMMRSFSSSSKQSAPVEEPTIIKQKKSGRKALGLGLVVIGTAATTITLLNKEQRKQLKDQIHHLHHTLRVKKRSSRILDIPGLPQNQGAVHGVSTRELGNFGFVTLSDGVKAADLVADISHGVDEVAAFVQQKAVTHPSGKKPLLILNETAYATTTATGLQKDKAGTPQFVIPLTQDNIEEFIERNRFPESSEFADLRDKCVRVTADGFVSNLSEFKDYELHFAVGTADAPPVVLVDHKKGVVGVVSCSWHNVAKGEIDDAINKMKQLGSDPANISMGIGPGLGPKSFEYGAADARNFYEPAVIDKRDGRPFQGRSSFRKHIAPHPTDAQKVLLNLPGMLAEIAAEHGIPETQVHYDSSWDSMTNTAFFSARRATPPEQREAESLRKYPKTSRGITFVHSLGEKNRKETPEMKSAEHTVKSSPLTAS